MLKGALLLIGLVLFALGAEGLYYAAANRQQVTVTCEAFAKSPPHGRWLRVTGCEIDYLGAGYRERGGRIAEMYFPVRAAGQPENSPAPIVARTTDADVLALAEATIGGGRTPDQEQFIVMMLEIVTKLRAARVIEGYANAALLSRVNAANAVAGLRSPVSPTAVIIDLHATPSFVLPAVTTAAGLLLIGVFFVPRSRRAAVGLPPSQETAIGAAGLEAHAGESPSRVEEEAPASGVAPVRREPALHPSTRLRVMLLNLPTHAGNNAIENAPPLGGRGDVIAALTHVVAGLRFDASGHAAIGRADFLLALDIGATDPVYTVVVDARGGAALPILRRILEATGWRAFAAKSGAFVDADRLEDAAGVPADHTAA